MSRLFDFAYYHCLWKIQSHKTIIHYIYNVIFPYKIEKYVAVEIISAAIFVQLYKSTYVLP